MPLHEGGRPMKPEFEGYAKVQVAIDSGGLGHAGEAAGRAHCGARRCVQEGYALPGSGRRPHPQLGG
eukprot:3043122-Alexandrium_andersonii.AAC.1